MKAGSTFEKRSKRVLSEGRKYYQAKYALIRKNNLKNRAKIVFTLEDLQVKDFSITTVFTRDESVTIRLYLKQARKARARHR